MSKILSISPSIAQGRKLIPKSEHHGPILKLTKKEQSLIDSLQAEVNNYQTEVYKIINLKRQATTETLIYYYNDILVHLTNKIDIISDKIKEIKTNRYRIQLENFQKKNK